MIRALAFAGVVAWATTSVGAPTTRTAKIVKPALKGKPGAIARVNFGSDLVPARLELGRNPSTLEQTAAHIQKLLRSNPVLRSTVTGLYVADAHTGTPLFAVNARDPLNVASNVKLISTATAIELLGRDYRYTTRLLGPEPVDGVVHGDIYLLGSYDPTLAFADYDDLGAALAERGITRVEGNIVVGADPTRDGIYRAIIPVHVTAGDPGQAAVAEIAPGFDLVTIQMNAITARSTIRPRLRYKTELTSTPAGQPRITLTISGVIGKDGAVDYKLWTKQRTATAAYATIAALRAHAITVTGELVKMELGDFIGESVGRGALPIELGRHQSAPVGEIARNINKWSINWLADRLVMTAAGLTRRVPPSMPVAVEAMYDWLDRRTDRTDSPARSTIVLDTGSGLSFRTQISVREIVAVLRSAAGFTGADPETSRVWQDTLAIAGTDGTLRHRFRGRDDIRGHIHGKTGTLHNVIALSGILDLDPQRPLAFSLVTNTATRLSRYAVRRAHEQVVSEIAAYVAKTTTHAVAPVPAPRDATPEPDDPDDEGADRDTVEP